MIGNDHWLHTFLALIVSLLQLSQQKKWINDGNKNDSDSGTTDILINAKMCLLSIFALNSFFYNFIDVINALILGVKLSNFLLKIQLFFITLNEK